MEFPFSPYLQLGFLWIKDLMDKREHRRLQRLATVEGLESLMAEEGESFRIMFGMEPPVFRIDEEDGWGEEEDGWME